MNVGRYKRAKVVPTDERESPESNEVEIVGSIHLSERDLKQN